MMCAHLFCHCSAPPPTSWTLCFLILCLKHKKICISKVHYWFYLVVKIIKRLHVVFQVLVGFFTHHFRITKNLPFCFMRLEFIFTTIHSSPPLCAILCGFRHLWSTLIWKPTILLLTCHRDAVSQCLRHSFRFISSRRHFTVSHHRKEKGECSAVRYLERERKRP